MLPAINVYGLDIETDNRDGNGLIPAKSSITQIALVTDTRDYVFEGDNEAAMIRDLYDTLAELPTGIVADWNGAFFDHPFILDRAKALKLDDVVERVVLHPRSDIQPKYDYLPGHTTGYSPAWPALDGVHKHYDASLEFKDPATRTAEDGTVVPWSLKPVLRFRGYEPVEIDRTRLHTYSPEDVRAYVVSDASGARRLTIDHLTGGV